MTPQNTSMKSTSYWLSWLGAGFVPLVTSLVLILNHQLIWACVFFAIVIITVAAFFSVTRKLRNENANLERVLTTVDKYSTAAMFRLYLLAITVWAAIQLNQRDEYGWAGVTLLVGLGLSMYFHIRNLKKFARHLDALRKETELSKALAEEKHRGQES